MYILIIGVLIALGVFLIQTGLQKKDRFRITVGAGLIVATAAFFSFLSFWGEALWFESVGFAQRFWKVFWVKTGLTLIGAAFGMLFAWVSTWALKPKRGVIRAAAVFFSAIAGGMWGLSQWETVLKYLSRVATGVQDPILDHDVAFYLFSLPFYQSLYSALLWLSGIAIAGHLFSMFWRWDTRDKQWEVLQNEQPPPRLLHSLYLNISLLILVLAGGKYLDRFELLLTRTQIITGAGWTDVNIRLLAYGVIILLMLVAAVMLAIPVFREKLSKRLARAPQAAAPWERQLSLILYVGIGIVAVWFIGLGLVPAAFQWLRVEPNEITYEKPYIKHNINFTRKAFKLDQMETRQFPAAENFGDQLVTNNQNLFDNIRLWDWRALKEVYNQFQEIRLYYEFHDVDIDRYHFNDKYHQVMVSAREMEVANLADQSQTFVNRRFKYTHGYGITLTAVHEFTPEGLPDLLIKDIPPKHRFDKLAVQRPEIYYGELTRTPVIVNSAEKEFDYPKGEKNMYAHYKGSGGVQLKNLWRKFIYGWKVDGTRLFLSQYPTEDSRIMLHRQIKDRVKKIAPFLAYDRDPYIVLADGKLYWMLDAYTASDRYPYSEQFSTAGIFESRYQRDDPFSKQKSSGTAFGGNRVNYARNAVKVVIDAYTGDMDFYVFEKEDPIINVWQNIFPELFKSAQQMPENLYKHIRYPAGMLLLQGQVYAKYHMTDEEVFYNQEDLWVRATEKYYNRVQPVDPYYILWEPPESDTPEFVLMLPFTPKNRQVLIGWIAGMCDGENYGRFLGYKFPKEKRVLGTQQVETKIDQDSYLSGQLTLWDQRGSNVIRGNVLAIPIDDILLYVEPIYLQSETAAYPELRLVVLMHNDTLSYAETFDAALKDLMKGRKPEAKKEAPGARAPATRTQAQQIQKANEAFENYLRLTGEKKFDQAADQLKQLQNTLQDLLNE
jgi:hypothetical protein